MRAILPGVCRSLQATTWSFCTDFERLQRIQLSASGFVSDSAGRAQAPSSTKGDIAEVASGRPTQRLLNLILLLWCGLGEPGGKQNDIDGFALAARWGRGCRHPLAQALALRPRSKAASGKGRFETNRPKTGLPNLRYPRRPLVPGGRTEVARRMSGQPFWAQFHAPKSGRSRPNSSRPRRRNGVLRS